MKQRQAFPHKVRLRFLLVRSALLTLKDSEKLEDSTNAARLIPAYNTDAERPEDIYPLHSIVPEPEWAALDSLLSTLKKAADDRSRERLLPNARSAWLQQHLMLAYSSPKPKSKIVYVPV